MSALKALTNDEILAHVEKGYFEICKERIELNEVRIIYGVAESIGEHFEAHSDNEILVLMDMQQDTQLMEEGLAREIINRIQKLKKKADLIPTDVVTIYYELEDDSDQISGVFNTYADMIVNTVKSPVKNSKEIAAGEFILIEEFVDIKGMKIKLVICSKDKPKQKTTTKRYINLLLGSDLAPRFGNLAKTTILIENPVTNEMITLEQLKKEIELVFGIFGLQFNIFIYNLSGSGTWELLSNVKCMESNSLLYITRKTSVENLEASDCLIAKPFVDI